MKSCPCNGDGVIDKGTDDEKQCPTCGDSGFVPDDNDDKNNEEVIRTSWEVPGRWRIGVPREAKRTNARRAPSTSPAAILAPTRLDQSRPPDWRGCPP
jgi:hypothetical protein